MPVFRASSIRRYDPKFIPCRHTATSRIVASAHAHFSAVARWPNADLCRMWRRRSASSRAARGMVEADRTGCCRPVRRHLAQNYRYRLRKASSPVHAAARRRSDQPATPHRSDCAKRHPWRRPGWLASPPHRSEGGALPASRQPTSGRAMLFSSAMNPRPFAVSVTTSSRTPSGWASLGLAVTRPRFASRLTAARMSSAEKPAV